MLARETAPVRILEELLMVLMASDGALSSRKPSEAALAWSWLLGTGGKKISGCYRVTMGPMMPVICWLGGCKAFSRM